MPSRRFAIYPLKKRNVFHKAATAISNESPYDTDSPLK